MLHHFPNGLTLRVRRAGHNIEGSAILKVQGAMMECVEYREAQAIEYTGDWIGRYHALYDDPDNQTPDEELLETNRLAPAFTDAVTRMRFSTGELNHDNRLELVSWDGSVLRLMARREVDGDIEHVQHTSVWMRFVALE